jgi:hypothetical protein
MMPCATAVIAISDFLTGEKNGHHGHGQRRVREKLTMVNKKHLKTGHQHHGANAYSNA